MQLSIANARLIISYTDKIIKYKNSLIILINFVTYHLIFYPYFTLAYPVEMSVLPINKHCAKSVDSVINPMFYQIQNTVNSRSQRNTVE